mmetsp:Transcript_36220/g.94922  ORF Transcript_36220/g.94922 Transcript_36220/m.94922 type:complete len:275 (+) Transcript_36220:278-1102(+)
MKAQIQGIRVAQIDVLPFLGRSFGCAAMIRVKSVEPAEPFADLHHATRVHQIPIVQDVGANDVHIFFGLLRGEHEVEGAAKHHDEHVSPARRQHQCIRVHPRAAHRQPALGEKIQIVPEVLRCQHEVVRNGPESLNLADPDALGVPQHIKHLLQDPGVRLLLLSQLHGTHIVPLQQPREWQVPAGAVEFKWQPVEALVAEPLEISASRSVQHPGAHSPHPIPQVNCHQPLGHPAIGWVLQHQPVPVRGIQRVKIEQPRGLGLARSQLVLVFDHL